MKKLLFILTMVLFPLLASAQTAEFKKFYKTYDNLESCTTIQMSGDMFVSLSGQSPNRNEAINSIFIVTTEEPTAQFKSDLNELILSPGYDLQTSINDDGTKVRIYVNKKNDKIVEILMSVQSSDEIVVMSIIGQNLNINSISQMANGATGGINAPGTDQ